MTFFRDGIRRGSRPEAGAELNRLHSHSAKCCIESESVLHTWQRIFPYLNSLPLDTSISIHIGSVPQRYGAVLLLLHWNDLEPLIDLRSALADMSNSSAILSQTLQSITAIKLRELHKQKASFASRKSKILSEADGAPDNRKKISILLEGIVKLDKSNTNESLEHVQDYELEKILGNASLGNIRRFLDQSRYDPSTPSFLLPEFERELRQILDQKDRKFDYADLYSRLLTEWLQSDAANIADALDNGTLDGEFEVVEKQKERLRQLSEKFESVVFTPSEVDTDAITKLLSGLFASEDSEKALLALRKRIKHFGNDFAARPKPINLEVLGWSITGLLQSDLLSDEKKNTLESFLKDDIALTEIADVLNMRFADLEAWSWDADEGIPVEPRRQLNGKYRVVMDEDILQSVFLHFIGTTWSIEFKSQLQVLVHDENVWQKTQTAMPRDESEKREYYLGKGGFHANEGIAWERQDTYEHAFFMCQLPTDVSIGGGGYDAEDEADARKPQESSQIKQQLLRTLGTEVLINRSLNGRVAVVRSDIQWFATSTSHSTVDTILEFFGVPKVWRRFFQRYLEAPLRMVGLEGDSDAVRTRKRGVPIGHVFQKLFGELIIFAMDLAVNQEAGVLLYRLHDDLWLCGEPEKCAKAWMAMERCAKTMGVEFNQSKTGSVYLDDNSEKDAQIVATLPEGQVVLGFLELHATTGNWVIDHKQVDAHVKQLKRQLSECNSIFAWIQTWNSCIGRFFNYTFGQPANCFGRGHVDMILETHQKMQQELFEDRDNDHSSVAEYLRKTISERFDVKDIPDAFLYYPEELGGLGLRNPFISFLVVRDQVLKDPQARMTKFFKQEKKSYKRAKDEFDALNERDRARRLDSIIGKNSDSSTDLNPWISITSTQNGLETKVSKPSWGGPTGTEFMTFAEFIEYRESSSFELRSAYNDLLVLPPKQDATPSREVSDNQSELTNGRYSPLAWNRMSSDRKWIIQLYSKDVLRRFGGLNIVDKGLLPMGVLTLLRNRKVTWQAVL